MLQSQPRNNIAPFQIEQNDGSMAYLDHSGLCVMKVKFPDGTAVSSASGISPTPAFVDGGSF